jgi:hypothetical protein
MVFRERLWLCLPPALLCLADAALTLWGQPSVYWASDYVSAEELNPVGYLLLAHHPLAFVAGVFCWLGVFAAGVLLLSRRLAILLSVVVAFGHALGGASWLARSGGWGWLLAVAFLLVAAEGIRNSWPVRTGT